MRCNPSAGAGRRRDYIMTMARFTIYVMMLGVKVGNSCRQSCAMRCNPSGSGAGAGAGDCVLSSRRRRRRDYIMTMATLPIYVRLLGVKVGNSCRRSCASTAIPARAPGRRRRRRRRDYIMTKASVAIYVMLLGAKVVNSCRQSCAMRCNPSDLRDAGAGAGAGIIS